MSAAIIERTRKGEHEPMLCAQTEWQGCSMKPIPQWTR
jgi:hypothetical protein